MKTQKWNVVGLLVAMVVTALPVSAKPGLLLVAHGSPRDAWNQPVMELGKRIAEKAVDGPFGAVRTAMMEFAQPDIPTMLAELEAEGCERVVVVPLFIAPSGHTHFDLPAILGIYGAAETRTHVLEEGGTIAVPTVPVTVAPTISESDVLPAYALAEVEALSSNPEGEAVVLLAHGDEAHGGLCDDLMRRAATYVCGKTGISYADWAFVEVGQSYRTEGASAIHAAGEVRERVLVVGLYTALTAEKMHGRVADGKSVEEMFEVSEVVFSNRPLIAFPALEAWVLEVAEAALPN